MGVLSREVRITQNPALGAMLLWRFICGFVDESESQNPVPFPLLFIILPMVFQEDIYELIKSTQKNTGLRGFADKFNQSKTAKHDILLNINTRALMLRSLTLDSFKLGVSSKLLLLDTTSGYVFPLSKTSPKLNIPNSVKDMIKVAEKLGCWCSRLSLHEISIILKVVF